MSKFYNQKIDIVPTAGGCTVIAIASNSANPASVPCKEVYVMANISNTGYINVGLSSAVNSIKGVTVPQPPAVAVMSAGGQPVQALRFVIDDLSKLFFYGTVNADGVGITWRL
jgi:hypothetical protein